MNAALFIWRKVTHYQKPANPDSPIPELMCWATTSRSAVGLEDLMVHLSTDRGLSIHDLPLLWKIGLTEPASLSKLAMPYTHLIDCNARSPEIEPCWPSCSAAIVSVNINSATGGVIKCCIGISYSWKAQCYQNKAIIIHNPYKEHITSSPLPCDISNKARQMERGTNKKAWMKRLTINKIPRNFDISWIISVEFRLVRWYRHKLQCSETGLNVRNSDRRFVASNSWIIIGDCYKHIPTRGCWHQDSTCRVNIKVWETYWTCESDRRYPSLSVDPWCMYQWSFSQPVIPRNNWSHRPPHQVWYQDQWHMFHHLWFR